MRLITDIFKWCNEHLPSWNTISISGYHMREAGSTAAQEMAFTLANGIAYTNAAREAGMDVDEFAGRLSFFFNIHNNFLEEIAKLRAARRMWARIMKDRFGAKNDNSMKLRFHSQTAGSTLTAQQPMNNIIRTSLQALAAVMGGTQSLHCNGFDEALALPTETAARIALRTQQIIANESGVTDTIDPFAGSYIVEYLTDELEKHATAYIEKIDAMGGAVKAIEAHYIQDEIARAAYETQKKIESGEQIVIGVNANTMEEPPYTNVAEDGRHDPQTANGAPERSEKKTQRRIGQIRTRQSRPHGAGRREPDARHPCRGGKQRHARRNRRHVAYMLGEYAG